MSISLLILCSIFLTSDADFDRMWRQVEKLEKEGLYKSSLEEVNKIFDLAQKENQDGHLLKAMIYKVKLQGYLEDNQSGDLLKAFSKDVELLKTSALRGVGYSLLAEAFGQHAQMHSGRNNQRSYIDDESSDDINSWSPTKIGKQINQLYLNSTEIADGLKSQDLAAFQPILIQAKDDKILNAKDLYELLYFRASAYFSQKQYLIPESVGSFKLDDPNLLSDADSFMNYNLASANNHAANNLIIFQKLMKFYSGKDALKFRAIDLKRIKYIHNNAIFESKDEKYLKLLEESFEAESSSQAKFIIGQTLIETYTRKGQMFSNNFEDVYKGYYKKADQVLQVISPTDGKKDIVNQLGRKINEHELDVNIELNNLPNQAIPIRVGYRNIKTLFAKVYKIDGESLQVLNRTHNANEVFQILKRQNQIQTLEFDLPNYQDLDNHATILPIDPLEKGFYGLLIADNPKMNSSENQKVVAATFSVTSIAYMARSYEGNTEVIVIDRKTGDPIENALVQIEEIKYDPKTRNNKRKIILEEYTNKDGLIKYSGENRNFSFSVKYQDDLLISNENFRNYKNQKSRESIQIHSFLDRAIYRPGQQVYFKAIAVKSSEGEIPQIAANEKVEVSLRDANWQEVKKDEYTTNEFGSIHDVYSLPMGLMNGEFTLQFKSDKGTSQSRFKVEEYKRPTFFVKMDTLDASFKLGDQVELSGFVKQYSGTSLQDAKVKYRITKRNQFFYYCGFYQPYYNRSSATQIVAVGNNDTSSNGKFEISFPTYPNANDYLRSIYEIEIDVTDQRGETNSIRKSLQLSNEALMINTDLPDQAFSTDLKEVGITVKNFEGVNIPAQATAVLTKLKGPDQIKSKAYWGSTEQNYLNESAFEKRFPELAYSNQLNPEQWESLEEVKKESLDTKTSKLNLEQLEGGYYKLEINATDSNNNIGEYTKYFAIANVSKNQIPAMNDFWISELEKGFEVGEKINYQLLTPYGNQRVHVSVHRPKSSIVSKWLNLNDDQDQELTLVESDRGGLSLDFWYVRNNRWYYAEKNIRVPWSNKELKVEYLNWRDKVAPGEQEELSIKISGTKKDAVAAELLVGMYDASLDAFKKHSWEKKFFFDFRKNSYWRNNGFILARTYTDYHHGIRNIRGVDLQYVPQVNWFGCYLGGSYYGGYVGEEMESMPRSVMKTGSRNKEVMAMDASVDAVTISQSNGAGAEYDEDMNAPPTQNLEGSDESFDFNPRENLEETVFFFPQLKTDSQGNLSFSFKHNEALTEWKMLLFGHTPLLEYVFDEKKVQTQKDLMILPNVPRFLRQNDEITLTAMLNNLTATPLNSINRIEVRDAVTDEDYTSLFLNDQQNESVLSGSSQNQVEWNLKIPSDFNASVKLVFMTKAGNFTDGEIHYLPVLSNRKLVTETTAFHIPANSNEEYQIQGLNKLDESQTIQSHQLTVEFTSNPNWFAIKSIPYLKERHHENAVDISQRIYANLLARKILDDHPLIETVFKQWEGSPDALKSNLSKNQELKNALLEQTPWVLDAMDEEEQMKNIAALFNKNNIAQSLQSDLSKLQSYQLSNGGFCWFPGGRENAYITQSILTSFGHLRKLGVSLTASHLDQMIKDAIRYTDQDIVEYHKRIKKHANHVHSRAIQFLYMRSFYDQEVPSKTKKVMADFYNWSKDDWVNTGTYLQAMIALSASRDNKMELRDRIVKSLDERAIKNRELGTYWKSQSRGYSWYDNAVERQALLIELYDELNKGNEVLDQMRLWLLKNKQTNRWENTKTTSMAIYALLKGQGSRINTEQAISVKLGNEELVFTNVEAGTHYYKTSFSAKSIKKEMADLRINNPNQLTTWGAAYFQYFEDLDKIEKDEKSSLQINKQLFKKVDSDQNRTLEPITKGYELIPGDQIVVRIELRNDREMEFIHLKDMRASGLEPVNTLSGYQYQDGLYYYETTKDLSTSFYFDRLPKGTFVFEYPLKVVHKGKFSNGITEIQSMYAPEFGNHSEGIVLEIGGK